MYFDFSESFVRVINKPNTLLRISKFVLLPLLRSGQELPRPRLEFTECHSRFLDNNLLRKNSFMDYLVDVFNGNRQPIGIVRVGYRLSKVCTHFYSSRSFNFTANTTTTLPTLESLSNGNGDGNEDVT